MSEKIILNQKEVLLKRKREIFRQIAHLEMGLQARKERVIEKGDAAQKEDLICLLDHLVERSKEEIREINRALEKMTAGKYGNCEICEKRIESKRLNILPATRLCRQCAKIYEKAQDLRQHLRDEIINDELLEEYRNMLDEDILRRITALHKGASFVDLNKRINK
ncbi:MAG: TraR/DksA C4-type zinc finger protein [Desulfobacterales bacterium]|jgi:DnaK suppressor protein